MGLDTIRQRHVSSALQLIPFRDALDSCSGEKADV